MESVVVAAVTSCRLGERLWNVKARWVGPAEGTVMIRAKKVAALAGEEGQSLGKSVGGRGGRRRRRGDERDVG